MITFKEFFYLPYVMSQEALKICFVGSLLYNNCNKIAKQKGKNLITLCFVCGKSQINCVDTIDE